MRQPCEEGVQSAFAWTGRLLTSVCLSAYIYVYNIALHQLNCKYQMWIGISATFMSEQRPTAKADKKKKKKGWILRNYQEVQRGQIFQVTRMWWITLTEINCFIRKSSDVYSSIICLKSVLCFQKNTANHPKLLHDTKVRRSDTEAGLTSTLWAAEIRPGWVAAINSTSIKTQVELRHQAESLPLVIFLIN